MKKYLATYSLSILLNEQIIIYGVLTNTRYYIAKNTD